MRYFEQHIGRMMSADELLALDRSDLAFAVLRWLLDSARTAEPDHAREDARLAAIVGSYSIPELELLIRPLFER